MRRFEGIIVSLLAVGVLGSCTSKSLQKSSPARIGEREAEFSRGDHDDPHARDRWFWQQRAYPTGRIPLDAQRAAIRGELRNKRLYKSGDGWENLGPAPLKNISYAGWSTHDSSGRALSIAIHPASANTILVGTAQGGIWKSSDEGASFHSVGEDNLPSLAIGVIRFAPSDPNVVYAGTGEGNGSDSISGVGVVKSEDGGDSWRALPSRGEGWNFEGAAITGLRVDPRDSKILYVTTAVVGSSLFSGRPEVPQTGVFRSRDGGESWEMVRAAITYQVNGEAAADAGFRDLEIGGDDAGNVLYASEMFGGIYRSVDRGDTWDLVTPRKPTGLGALPAEVSAGSVHSDRDGRDYLLRRFAVRDDLPDFGRIELAVASSNPFVVYAGYEVPLLLLDADADGNFDENKDIVTPAGLLFKSEDGGASWRFLGSAGDGGAPDYCHNQCDYDNAIAVNPNDPNDVIIGGSADYSDYAVDSNGQPSRVFRLPWRGVIYRSRDGGRSWIDTTPHCTAAVDAQKGREGVPLWVCSEVDPERMIHPDVHDIAFAPDGRMYVANDGGLFRATAGGAGTDSYDYRWENLNRDLSTLQFYRFDAHPTNPNIILGGLQDNSCAYYDGNSWEGWGFGDGTFAAFDPLDPSHVYMGTQNSIHRHDGGGAKPALDPSGQAAGGWNLFIFNACKIPVNDCENGWIKERVPFLPVFAIDPLQPNYIYAASSTAMYESSDRGETWRRVGKGETDGEPTAITVSAADNNIMWLGTMHGALYRYDYRAGTVTRINGLPPRSVSKIVAAADDPNTAFVAFNGYDANTPSNAGKVFGTRDGGASWANLSGNLPDVPVSAFAVDPSNSARMWVGTDVGVFETVDGGGSWQSDRLNMPVIAVMDLNYNRNTGFLLAATHGRGMWRRAVAQ